MVCFGGSRRPAGRTNFETYPLKEAAVMFAAPQMLWLLLVFPPALIAFFWWSARLRKRLMTQFIQARLLPGLIAGLSSTRQKVRAGLVIAAVVFVILALGRPRW